MSLKIFIVILVLAFQASPLVLGNGQPFTPAEMETILHTIDNYFFLPNSTYKVEIRKFLRGAFHDCLGGCDGSLNLERTGNRGLQKFAKQASEAYRNSIMSTNANNHVFKRLTRADFWVLCQERALGWGIKNSNTSLNLSGIIYLHGRPCELAEHNDPDEPALPSAIGQWASIIQLIKKGIPTITEKDIVALLGLHGAGSADPYNSGFKGPWGPLSDFNVVNNHFFINLLNVGFPDAMMTQVQALKSKYPDIPDPNIHFSPPPPTNLIEWQPSSGNSPVEMMLPADMQIYLNFTANATGGQDIGDYCPQGNNETLFDCSKGNNKDKKYLSLAKNAELAFSYAKNNSLYVNDVVTAFLKMVSYTQHHVSLTPYRPGWGCVDGEATCLGDILFSGCPQPVISC